MIMRKSVVTLAAILGGFIAMPAHAQFAYGGDADIFINAEKATYKGNLTILEGSVDIQQGDTRLLSDVMDIYRDGIEKTSTNGTSMGAVTRIVAKGNFKYVTPDSTVTGNKGIYERRTGIIVVTGNVKIIQVTGNTATTDRLTYNVKTGTIKFEGNCLGRDCANRPTVRIGN